MLKLKIFIFRPGQPKLQCDVQVLPRLLQPETPLTHKYRYMFISILRLASTLFLTAKNTTAHLLFALLKTISNTLVATRRLHLSSHYLNLKKRSKQVIQVHCRSISKLCQLLYYTTFIAQVP